MSQVWAFIVGHQGLVAGLVVGVFDLLFALAPNLQSNGILHAVYLWVKGLVKPAQ